MNSPITYWGGKKIMARHIVPLIPAHTTYVEPFFGGGAIYFLKTPSEVEVINDTNRFVVNFFQQIKANFDSLQIEVQTTPHSRSLYKGCRKYGFKMLEKPDFKLREFGECD
jgi:DNA adenine methylase